MSVNLSPGATVKKQLLWVSQKDFIASQNEEPTLKSQLEPDQLQRTAAHLKNKKVSTFTKYWENY